MGDWPYRQPPGGPADRQTASDPASDSPDNASGPGRPRRRGRLAAAGAITVAVIGGVSWWGVSHPGTYGRSHDGCVTVSVPSSTGGALMHGCGASARVMCRNAFASHDKLALATRPQCRLADLGPSASSTP
jgi:hypothetical protein